MVSVMLEPRTKSKKPRNGFLLLSQTYKQREAEDETLSSSEQEGYLKRGLSSLLSVEKASLLYFLAKTQ